MAVVRTIRYDDAERTDWTDTDDQTGLVTHGTDWKPGSGPYNQDLNRDRLETALTYFAGNYANWPGMTNNQKDAANRQAQRALANVARWLLGRSNEAPTD
jgi:hypothetical protein